MGYVNLTDICQFIPPSLILKTGGTWVPTFSSHLLTQNRSAGAGAFSLLTPIVLPGSNIAKQGAKLVSVDFWYIIETADASTIGTVQIDKMTYPVSGTAPTGAAVATTCDTAHDTDAERRTIDNHKMNVALDTPAFIEDDEGYWLTVVVEAAATTVFKLVGAQANFTLRL